MCKYIDEERIDQQQRSIDLQFRCTIERQSWSNVCTSVTKIFYFCFVRDLCLLVLSCPNSIKNNKKLWYVSQAQFNNYFWSSSVSTVTHKKINWFSLVASSYFMFLYYYIWRLKSGSLAAHNKIHISNICMKTVTYMKCYFHEICKRLFLLHFSIAYYMLNPFFLFKYILMMFLFKFALLQPRISRCVHFTSMQATICNASLL